MTTPLNNVIDYYDALTPKDREIVDKLSLVDYVPTRQDFVELYDTVMSFVHEIRRGKRCVGTASAHMINSAVFYLRQLGVNEIPGFDLSKFDSRSKHRSDEPV
jgi:pantothenate kinase-related protein Tda10